MLQDLQLECRIQSPRDLEYLKKLKACEIEELITGNTQLQEEIINAIGTLENFIMFTHEVNLEVLSVLLKAMRLQLLTRFVNNAPNFQALLMTHFQPELFLRLYTCFNNSMYTIRPELFNPQQMNLIISNKVSKLDFLTQSTEEEIRTLLGINLNYKMNLLI